MGSALLNWRGLPEGPLWLLHPPTVKWELAAVRQLQNYAPKNKDMVWLRSSGTQAVEQIKFVGLSRAAILHSAKAVNQHLRVRNGDIWALALPTYHIGGFAILARAFVSQTPVVSISKWNPQQFFEKVHAKRVTLTSLVPTQIYDLVKMNLRSPPSLRAVVVGGARLEPDLYQQARDLKWPLLPSYGLSECASQVATASLSSLRQAEYPKLDLLTHIEAKVASPSEGESLLQIRSPALCRWIARIRRDGEYSLETSARGGWFTSEDLVCLQGRQLAVEGRRDDVVKINGLFVSIPQVEAELRKYLHSLPQDFHFCVVAIPDSRRGHRLILLTNFAGSLEEVQRRVDAYNQAVSGLWQVTPVAWLKEWSVSALGKPLKGKMRAMFT